jgi:hypothetical protein
MRGHSTPTSRKGSYRLLGVLKKYFGIVRNPSLLLGLRACTVNAGRSFGGVTTHEPEAHHTSTLPGAFAGENHTPLFIQQ